MIAVMHRSKQNWLKNVYPNLGDGIVELSMCALPMVAEVQIAVWQWKG